MGRPRKNPVPQPAGPDLISSDPVKAGEEIARTEMQKPKKRGSNGKPPPSRAGLITTDEDKVFVSGLLSETLHAYKQPRVKSDEELQERLDDYFRYCADTGQIPTVEEMALYIGYGRSYLWDLEAGRRKGFSDSTADIIKKAKDFLCTFDAKLVVSGKMNFLAYCFRAKNYYGMSDKTEYVITPNNQSEDEYDEHEIAARYMFNDSETDDSVIETDFAE